MTFGVILRTVALRPGSTAAAVGAESPERPAKRRMSMATNRMLNDTSHFTSQLYSENVILNVK